MYLHLGESTVVREKDIIGIFDLDTTTVMKASRNFINKASKEGNVVNVSFELPKAFVVTRKKKETNKTIYISQLSSQTLYKRIGKMIVEE